MTYRQLTIDISPPANVYSTYRRLSYQPWYAIAEFVDNSTQNYLNFKRELDAVYKKEGVNKLRINIDYDNDKNTLVVQDNAHGMNFEEIQRAVKLNCPPPNTSGRCEYGMGLKTAACWFGTKWTIETVRLGSRTKYSCTVDVNDLPNINQHSINVKEISVKPEEHYSIVTIENLYKTIQGRTSGRIKDQLTSMYRRDISSSNIEIIWNGTPLKYVEPEYLTEKHRDGSKTQWQKGVQFTVFWEVEKRELHVNGWVAIRQVGKQRDAGFALFRRGRVVIGGPDKGYKPEDIFGQGNTFRSQRLIGELDLDDWPVTQAKDAFDWTGGLEDSFIDILKTKCKDYMEKAEDYRQRSEKTPITMQDMQAAGVETTRVFENKEFTKAIGAEISLPTPPPTANEVKEDIRQLRAMSEGPLNFTLPTVKGTWQFKLFWQSQNSDAHWMQVEYPSDTEIHIFLNSSHPFFEPYLKDYHMIELLQKFVLSLALAEKLSRNESADSKVDAADFRMHMNLVLRYAGKIRCG